MLNLNRYSPNALTAESPRSARAASSRRSRARVVAAGYPAMTDAFFALTAGAALVAAIFSLLLR